MDSEIVKVPEVFIEPGYVFFSKQPVNLCCVLGTCVAVCIWDEKLKYGGMCHYLYPTTHKKEKATTQYGNVAITQLIRFFDNEGSDKKYLVAQIIGGAHPKNIRNGKKYESIGEKNIEIARTILQKKGIKIVSEDVGGNMGRKIIYNTATGHLMILKVFKIRKDDWITEIPE